MAALSRRRRKGVFSRLCWRDKVRVFGASPARRRLAAVALDIAAVGMFTIVLPTYQGY
jgi:hypothetical protein